MIADYVYYATSNIEKYKGVKAICRIELSKAKANWHTTHFQNLNKKHSTNIEDYYSENFSKTLACLTDLSKKIIIEEFLRKNKNQFWYEEYFSKSTYYKRRSEAIIEFLSLYTN
ncbi:MG284/MPN403 family protein [Mycoplasma sp. Mirounga ES2805-ORL]|uniref:MG284/MPN403 family protein n=1 Tax=Mycoplasma sp. Mirounga ES2805-ORL TaxID=754514 RepID=UPI00197CB4AD|nr:hypothetical protein [Mycoplasma sp. Mirounga ES2805-ORL]QSF13469.1 hypothetical protein JXZ90_02210 [Mycoplasma sp. Mirounga ES2805-ORL]